SASEPELEAAAAQQVEGCSGFGQAGRRPEWEVGYVGKEAHSPALAEQHTDQGHGVQESWCVRVVLNTDQLEAGLLGGPYHLADAIGPARKRRGRDAQFRAQNAQPKARGGSSRYPGRAVCKSR